MVGKFGKHIIRLFLDHWCKCYNVFVEIIDLTYGFFQNAYFKERNNMAFEKNLGVTINSYKRCLPIIAYNKKYSST